ncbi:LPXTG cell wall anchor domain-containing protein [Brevibacterium sp. GP-SGM9]|uniref:LPXTG cell wall anchor domain-containing protein n=1 Tax=Brevibacterium sp. GP-SGM9 TaxID=3376990 RepID=UPI0039A64D38
MKKLALAPAVALAITGLAASPVMAAPSADAFGQTNVQASQSEKTEATEEGAEDGAETQAIEASVSVTPETISQADLVDPGVTVKVTGLEAGDVVSDTLTNEKVTAKGDSVEFNIHNVTGDPAAVDPGTLDFNVSVTRGEETKEFPASVTVTEGDDDGDDDAPAVDPKVSIDTEEISVSEFEKNGLKLTGEGFTPGAKVNVFGNATQSPFFDTQVEADEDGKISATVEAPKDGLEPDTYSVSAVDAETETVSNYVNFELTADETEDPTIPAAEAKLTVSPETVSPADFVEKDKGVTLAVENCEPGEDVHYVVNPKGNSNVTAYDNTVKADDEGKASVNVYGTSASDADAYIGDYEVTVTCGDAELNGEFSVSDDANAGGSDGDEDGNEDGNGDGGNGGSDLPRTGTELTGLVGGGALLLIGGAAVAMTMRRKKVTQDPSQI